MSAPQLFTPVLDFVKLNAVLIIDWTPQGRALLLIGQHNKSSLGAGIYHNPLAFQDLFQNKINLQVSGGVYSFERLEYEGPDSYKLNWPGLLWRGI